MVFICNDGTTTTQVLQQGRPTGVRRAVCIEGVPKGKLIVELSGFPIRYLYH